MMALVSLAALLLVSSSFAENDWRGVATVNDGADRLAIFINAASVERVRSRVTFEYEIHSGNPAQDGYDVERHFAEADCSSPAMRSLRHTIYLNGEVKNSSDAEEGGLTEAQPQTLSFVIVNSACLNRYITGTVTNTTEAARRFFSSQQTR